MRREKQQKENKFYITKAWTVAFLIIIGGMIVYYLIWVKPKDTNLKESLKNIGTIMPLFIYVSTVVTEILEVFYMLGKVLYEKIQENKQAKIEEAITKVLTALPDNAESVEEKQIVEKAVENYKAKNGGTGNGNTDTS